MDGVLEQAVKFALRGLYLLLRLAVWLVLELGIEIILWQVGWCACRTLTLNRYPGVPITGQNQASRLSLFLVCSIGFVALVAIGIGLALQSG
ncbi:hypothetical protein [Pseudomonas sp. BN102]|uniref:hypothetical protein n=1 Tax=Pseudomonas sp. BN102 TaxID=2567886 RepID=UPI0024537B0A|nr:hypothetical protein [Pseudomonas sp. BN102]